MSLITSSTTTLPDGVIKVGLFRRLPNQGVTHLHAPPAHRQYCRRAVWFQQKQSSEKVQTSLFHEVANQPEARQWVEQVRVANKQLNQSLFSSVEYDGDAFMPSGMVT